MPSRSGPRARKAADCGPPHDEPSNRVVNVNDRYEAELSDAIGGLSEHRNVREQQAIHFPGKAYSTAIVTRARVWTSWIHYALFFPHFEHEHDQYWADQQTPDPLWSALYFSVLSSTLLFMDETGFQNIQPPLPDRTMLLKNCYEAALYYLDEADFLQNIEVRFVQSTII